MERMSRLLEGDLLNQKSVNRLEKRTILIIEDDEISRLILAKRLSEEYDVLTAENGKEGLDLLKEHPDVTLVVLDILMPVLDGYEFLSIVKNNELLYDIPVVVITGNFSDEEEIKCLEMGAIDFLSKPYNPQEALVRIRNVIQMQESSNALLELERDELTGLYTKQAFIKYAEERVQSHPEKEYAIIGFNIENFKATNSQYGEEKCDEFLAYLGEKIQRVLRSSIAGRFGGDQFVILFDNDDEKTTIGRVEQISKLVFRYAPIPNQVAKIGVYAPIDKRIPIVRCCDRAFLAIREVKGVYQKDIIFYEERMREQLLEEQKILDSMETALKEEQFVVFYQPKHEAIGGMIAGAEALVRWEHPEFGFMTPDRFIPLFERNGFITKLDLFVVERVCKDITNWKEKGLPLVPISINVSRRDYFEAGWLEKASEIVDSYEIDHSLIHMEVTESLYAENTDLIIDQIRRVQNRGFLVEMDDFGAGYSSLGMLATFPLNVIKLDISFVRQIETNRVVIENIIKLAHKMGLKTVAEGAESEKQFHILRNLGCDFIQGYYFSKPLSLEAFEHYLVQDHSNINVTSAADAEDIVVSAEQEKEDEQSRINSLLSIIQSLEESAHLDSLTGFPNRRAFYGEMERLERIGSKQSMGIAYVDINGLKSMNDNFGHEAGDRLIVHIAASLKKVFADADIFRLGGDEFVVFERGISEEAFKCSLDELHTYWTEEESASVGWVWSPITRHIEQNVIAADKRMYIEKNIYYDRQFKRKRRGGDVASRSEFEIATEMMDFMPCGFFAYFADETGRLLLHNQEVLKLFECENDDEFKELTGYSFRGMVHPDDIDLVEGSINSQIEKSNDLDYVEYRIICKNGKEKRVRDYGRFVRTGAYGSIYMVVLIEMEA